MPLGCAWLRLNTATIGTLDLMHTLDSISTPQAFFNSPGLYFKFQLPRPFSTPQAFISNFNSPGLYFKFQLPRPLFQLPRPFFQLPRPFSTPQAFISTPQAFLLTLFPLPRPFQMFDHPCLQLNILFKSIYIYMME